MGRIGRNAPGWPEELKKGYLKLLILASLSRRPMHGYEIMKEAAERTLGLWKPTAGGTYPLLRKMEGDGWIKGEWRVSGGRRRKVYRMTRKGGAKLRRLLKIHGTVLRIAHRIHSELGDGMVEGAGLEEIDRTLSLLRAQLKPGGLGNISEEERARILRLLRDRLERIERVARKGIEAIDEALGGSGVA